MKAYSIKMVLILTEYEVIREAVVPGGISFSQFAVILEQIIGREDEKDFSFIFDENSTLILEKGDITMAKKLDLNVVPAQTAYINQYFDKGVTFGFSSDTYLYMVSVEDVVEVNPEEELSPVVTFASGNCPPPDMPDLDEWIELMDAYYNAENPLHTPSLQYLAQFDDYNIEIVNSELKKSFFYTWGNAETGLRFEIQGKIFLGRGIMATEEENPLIEMGTVEHVSVDDFDETFVAIYTPDNEEYETTLHMADDLNNMMEEFSFGELDFTVKDMLESMEKDELNDMAETYGQKELSGLEKEELIEKFNAYLTEKDTVRRCLTAMTTLELKSIDRIICSYEAEHPYYEMTVEDGYATLLTGMYLSLYSYDRAALCTDFVTLYKEIIQEEGFYEKQRKAGYVKSCILTGIEYYGNMPDYIFSQLLHQSSEFTFTKEEVEQIIDYFPEDFKSEFHVRKDCIVKSNFVKAGEELVDIWGDIPYYIPTEEEILLYGAHKYIYTEANVAVLANELMLKGFSKTKAYNLAGDIANNVLIGTPLEEIIGQFIDAFSPDPDHITETFELLKNFFNQSRMIFNRGYTPIELLELHIDIGDIQEKLKKRPDICS